MKPAVKHEAKSRRSPSAAPTDQTTAKEISPTVPTKRPLKQKITKQAQVVAMLQQPAGTTVAAVMKATGWQKHSVHGFLAGIVRKKLGLNIESEVTNGERVYRIADAKRSKSGEPKTKKAA